MNRNQIINRRRLMGLTGSALAFTVVPLHVPGWVNYVPLSDTILLRNL